MSFSLIYAVLRSIIGGYDKRTILSSIIGAIGAVLGVAFAGNGHYLIYGIIAPIIEKTTGKIIPYCNESGYFFPDSTIFIGNFPETMDKGKNEFLAYSVVLGDLHAHVINLLFVIPILAIGLDIALEEKKETPIFTDIIDARHILTGILLGLFMGCNYWDFPIYFIILGALILFHDCKCFGVKLKTVLFVLVKGAFIIGIAYVVSLPHSLHFVKMASELCIAENHTPIDKFVILWGFPITIAVILSGSSLYKIIKKEAKLSDYAILSVSACAIGLIFVPEFIYIKDIYGSEYARFNTMFKLTYQAFTLLGLIGGMAVGLWFYKQKYILFGLTGLITILLSTYLLKASSQFFGDISDVDYRYGCSAYHILEWEDEYDAEKEAISLINEDPKTNIRIMEACGDSYSHSCRIPVFTGACTYLGWEVHEWLWRGDWEPVGEREEEIRRFYEAGDKEYNIQLLKNNKIDYVFVGPVEMKKYLVNPRGFEGMGINLLNNSQYRLYNVSNL